MDLVVNVAGGVALYAHAQRPHAALLFAEFLISPEGQKFMEDNLKFGSPFKDYGFRRWSPVKGMTVAQYDQAERKWLTLLSEITRK
jgi:ABC-type Fe3+ transport system substrate-binding protein